jgi:L-iditol 2-dehydrogenase
MSQRKKMQVAELVELGRIEMRTADVPTPKPNEVRLRVRAVGLCGTDVKAFLRGHPFFRPPCVLGHELVGLVDEVGAAVRSVVEGDRVVCAPYVECGACPTCRKGLGELCERKVGVAGALQEYLIVPSEILGRGTFRISDEVTDDVATLTEPLACVINGIERAGVREGDSVLVVGGGPMGTLLALLSETITSHVLVSEVVPARVALLRAQGLSVVQPGPEPLAAALERSFGEPSADRVLIAVGVRSVAEEAIGWASAGGTALLFGGLPREDRLTIDPFAIHYREASVVGSFGFRLEHFEEAVAWIEEHPHALDGLVTATVRFADVASAFGRAAEPDGLKTVIRFDGAG